MLNSCTPFFTMIINNKCIVYAGFKSFSNCIRLRTVNHRMSNIVQSECSIMSGDEIVITGIAGKFPNSENVDVFQKNLLNMKNCLTSRNPKWKTANIQIPEKNGHIQGTNNFDALALGVNKKFAENMDPLGRMLLQTACESISDAGINPRTLKGKKVAVFIGSGIGETELILDSNPNQYSVQGNGKALIANRISFFLDLHGPSIIIKSLSTSSATAIEKAYLAIKNGEVESAIVGGGNIVQYPHLSLQFSKLGLLSPDGITKSFDESANGYTRSEAAVVFFLQKAKDAKRIYAEIKNVHSLNGPSYERFSTLFPNSDFQNKVMKKTLEECGLSGKDISFVEADGLGIKEADIEEIKAIDQVYNDGRKGPLLIGSVKSNVGSCHAADTLVSIVKIIAMFESNIIPPNLHYKNPSKQTSAIHEGRIEVVTKPTSWNGEYAAVNTTSIGGGFANVILKSFGKKKKIEEHPADNLPKLTMVSGVTEDAVNQLIDYLETKPVSSEMFQLLNDVFETEDASHLYRGYTLLPPFGNETPKYHATEFVTGFKKEIWYVFSGMGSQWPGMGKELMNLPVFAESVYKCDAVLKPYKIDIIKILTSDDLKMFDNIVNSFVGIITIQIGLVDLLTYLEIKPDYIIGHSLGELGCAYADGCLSAEQAVLNALFRGFASLETELIKGSMAAVGLGYEDIKPLCPPDIDVACHNSSKSSTISGPVESMKTFVTSLQAKGVFTKEVDTSNIAYHSRYIEPAGSKLQEYLQQIIPDAKLRSDKWLSTSVPIAEWKNTKARLSSAEYYTNNLLNPVLFEEVTKNVPENAVIIEIAPHGLLQSILKRSLSKTVINLTLTRKHQNNVDIFMDAIGKLYINSGYRACISKLYPSISYPVSTGTPSLSQLIKWDHSEVWCREKRKLFFLSHKINEKVYKIDLKDEQWRFLRGHRIDGANILPCSLYLKLVSSTMEAFQNSNRLILFENIVVHENKYIIEDEILELTVMVQTGSGNFEVKTGKELLCSGIFQKINSIKQEQPVIGNLMDGSKGELGTNELYTEMFLRGYHYTESYQTICKFNPNNSIGQLFYQKDWCMVLEGMFQMYMYKTYMQSILVPFKIRKLFFDLDQYETEYKNLREIPVSVNENFQIINSYGMEIIGIELITLKQDSKMRLRNIQEIKFTFDIDESPIAPKEFAYIVIQILIENNINGNIIQIIDDKTNVLDESEKLWRCILEETSETQFKFEIVSSLSSECDNYKNTALKVLFDVATLRNINLSGMPEGDFMLVILDSADKNDVLNTMSISDTGIIFERIFENQVALLFRKKRKLENIRIIEITEKDLAQTNQIVENLKASKGDQIVLLARHRHFSIPNEICNILSSEELNEKINYFEIMDSKAPDFSLEEPLYRNQLQLNLKFNVLKTDKKWCSRRSFPIVNKHQKVANWMAFQSSPGDMNSIDWVEQHNEKVDHKKCINVKYATINTFDVLLASENADFMLNESYCKKNRTNTLKMFGLEYAGTNENGERIMGISGSGTLCRFTSPDSELMWEIPNSWTMEEAATVPLAYTTAYMTLYLKGDIKRKSSIFIYDGSCAVGQAMITLALNEGLQVYSTYRTEKEKELLKLQNPTLNEDRLFCLKDLFEYNYLFLTRGAKVDLVIYNAYKMDGFEACLKCVKDKLGIFIIVGQLQESFRKSLGMLIFEGDLIMLSIIPHNLVNADVNTKKILNSLFKDGLKKGVIKPVYLSLYSRGDLRKAFLVAGNGTIYGKIVIEVQSVDDANCKALVIPRFSCFKNKTYLLLVDDWNNFFGIKLIDFLIENGAKDIIVVSVTRNCRRVIYHHRLKNWEEREARVVLRDNIDLFKNYNVRRILNEALKLNPIEAVFDLQRMTAYSSNLSKYFITKSLFEESKKICTDLRHFVICTMLKDPVDDVNTYLFKNSNLMTLCEERLHESLPMRLVLWGPIEGIFKMESLAKKKCKLYSIHECMLKLTELMTLPSGIFMISNIRAIELTTDVKEICEKELFENYIFNRI